MTLKTVKKNHVEITYNTCTMHIVRGEFQVGDCLFTRFDETATYVAYHWLKRAANDPHYTQKPPALSLTNKERAKGEKINLLQKLWLKKIPPHLTIPPLCWDLEPAYVFFPQQKAKELLNEFDELLNEICAHGVNWPEDAPVQ